MNRFLLVGLLAVGSVSTALAQPRDPVVKFDNRQVDVREVNGHWWLFASSLPFKDLGASERDAQAALWLIRELRLTHHSTIGTPEPVIEYWLADGKAPQGTPQGIRQAAFHPEALHIEEVQGQWCLSDGRQPMFGFGGHREEAAQALAIVRHYGFNHVGYVGSPIPVMMCFYVGEAAPPTPILPRGKAPKVSPPLALLLPLYQLSVPGMATDDVYFDPHRVEVCCEGKDWKLMVGNLCLADFGPHEEDAREARRIVEFYAFSEQRKVGRSPGLTYYLVNGQAPHGLMLGLQNIEFRPDNLELCWKGEEWQVCDNGRLLLSAGKNREEAEQLLQVIQRYEFDHICQLGSVARPLMTFLVQDR